MKLINLEIIKRNKLINFRASIPELKEIKDKANKYTDGDISKWIRYSAIKYTPKKKDLVKE